MIGELLLPQKALVLHEPIAIAEQKQTNKIEQRDFFFLTLFQRFEALGDCSEHRLVGPGNAHSRSVDRTDVIHDREGNRSQESGASRNAGNGIRLLYSATMTTKRRPPGAGFSDLGDPGVLGVSLS